MPVQLAASGSLTVLPSGACMPAVRQRSQSEQDVVVVQTPADSTHLLLRESRGGRMVPWELARMNQPA